MSFEEEFPSLCEKIKGSMIHLKGSCCGELEDIHQDETIAAEFVYIEAVRKYCIDKQRVKNCIEIIRNLMEGVEDTDYVLDELLSELDLDE